jgi:hypothetical protein
MGNMTQSGHFTFKPEINKNSRKMADNRFVRTFSNLLAGENKSNDGKDFDNFRRKGFTK